MRMRRQLIIAAAVAFATLAVIANGYAATRAAIERSNQLAHQTPLPNLTVAATPINDADDGTFAAVAAPRSATADPAEEYGIVHRDVYACDTDQWNSASASNHGLFVSACIAQLREVGGIDGPPGLLIRGIARPDFLNDGLPRSDRAEEHSSNDEKPGSQATPPSQFKGKSQKDKDR